MRDELIRAASFDATNYAFCAAIAAHERPPAQSVVKNPPARSTQPLNSREAAHHPSRAVGETEVAAKAWHGASPGGGRAHDLKVLPKRFARLARGPERRRTLRIRARSARLVVPGCPPRSDCGGPGGDRWPAVVRVVGSRAR